MVLFYGITIKVYLQLGYLPVFPEKRIRRSFIVDGELWYWETFFLVYGCSIAVIWLVVALIVLLVNKNLKMLNKISVILMLAFIITYSCLVFFFTGYMDWFYD